MPPYVELSPDPYGNPKTTFTPEEFEAISKPKVLISEGGVGGLTLVLLLLKANIPFLVLERAKEIKPLGKYDLDNPTSLKSEKLIILSHRLNLIGSAIALGPMVAPLFIQLRIYDEFLKRG